MKDWVHAEQIASLVFEHAWALCNFTRLKQGKR